MPAAAERQERKTRSVTIIIQRVVMVVAVMTMTMLGSISRLAATSTGRRKCMLTITTTATRRRRKISIQIKTRGLRRAWVMPTDCSQLNLRIVNRFVMHALTHGE